MRTPMDYDYPDRLYQEDWSNAKAYGIIINGMLIAAIELYQERWSKRLRITELWIMEEYQKKGLGKLMIEFAKNKMKEINCRALILETQSCNSNAIDFYMHQGFTLIGFDTCSYSNRDIERKEVRFEFGWYEEER